MHHLWQAGTALAYASYFSRRLDFMLQPKTQRFRSIRPLSLSNSIPKQLLLWVFRWILIRSRGNIYRVRVPDIEFMALSLFFQKVGVYGIKILQSKSERAFSILERDNYYFLLNILIDSCVSGSLQYSANICLPFSDDSWSCLATNNSDSASRSTTIIRPLNR